MNSIAKYLTQVLLNELSDFSNKFGITSVSQLKDMSYPDLYEIFQQEFPDRQSYINYLDFHAFTFNDVSDIIRKYRVEARDPFSVDQSLVQSYKDHLGNAITILCFIRTAARTWRYEANLNRMVEREKNRQMELRYA